MSSSVADSATQRFSCKCLNVLLQTAVPTTAPPESVADPAYTQVFVGDQGIAVQHPQLTLRARTRVAFIAATSRCSRYTTLACLLCDIVVYRVLHIVVPDVEGKDGPILPAEDWVERETLKSSTGWIEIYTDCLVENAIAKAEASPAFSPLFNLLLPSPPPLPPPSPKMNGNPAILRDSLSTPEPTLSYFSHLRPLFPPPPFTPSHPAFLHLVSLADIGSRDIRDTAEKHTAEVVRQKTAEIEQEEGLLKQQVETLWRKFRESVKKAQAEAHPPITPRSPSRSSQSRERDQYTLFTHSSTSPQYGTPLTVREFVPVSVPLRSSSSPPPRSSNLSASLATSFHHPKSLQGTSSPIGSNDSLDSGSSRTLSTRSGSSTLVQPTGPEGINILQFRRSIDDTVNTQASYRYFVDLGDDIARQRQQKETSGKKSSESANDDQEAGPSRGFSNSTTSGNKERNGATNPPKVEFSLVADELGEKNGDGLLRPRGRDAKGKRKVTFDVEPDIVTIRKDAEAENGAEAIAADQQDAREMIFDLEDMDDETGRASPRPPQVLPLLEQPVIARPPRYGKARSRNATGLPQSFSGLRPSSLPNPSHIRPIRSQPGVDSSSRAMMLSLPQAPGMLSRLNGVNTTQLQPTDLLNSSDPNVAELMRLVAADAPSHRGAWNKDGRTWQIFARRSSVSGTTIPEEREVENGDVSGSEFPPEIVSTIEEEETENEDDDDQSHTHVGVAGSLPIQIRMKTRPRAVLSLASYKTQSAIPQQQVGEAVSVLNGKPASSSTIRKALYAERDLSRSMDPGALDFATEEEDEEEDEDENEGDSELGNDEAISTGRGRKRALKILQARNELPAAGMWRSLAS